MAGSGRAAVLAAVLLLTPAAAGGTTVEADAAGAEARVYADFSRVEVRVEDSEARVTAEGTAVTASLRSGDHHQDVSAGPVRSPVGPALECDVGALAREVYGKEVHVEPLENVWWEQAFRRHDLFLVTETDRFPLPEHAFAVDHRRCEGLDVTRDIPAIQRRDVEGLALATPEQAREIAFAYATTVDRDTIPSRQVVTSEDESWLGHPIQDPEVDLLLTGQEVTFSTWSPRGGVLLHWDVNMAYDGLANARIYVHETGLGPHVPAWERTNLRSQTFLVHEYGGSGPVHEHRFHAFHHTPDGFQDLQAPRETRNQTYELVAAAGTFDGATVEVTHPNVSRAPAGLAEDLATGLAAAYDDLIEGSEAACGGGPNPDANLGFRSTDPDCTLEVRLVDDRSLLCVACVVDGNQTRLYVAENLASHLASQGLYGGTPVTEAMAESLTGHLYLHRLQERGPGWAPELGPVLEGQALAVQSFLAPTIEARPPSSFVALAGNGPTGFQPAPEAGLCARPGATGVFLGYLADVEGTATFRETLVGLEAHGDGTCPERTAQALADAVGSGATPSRAVAEARLDFAGVDLLGDLAWGTVAGQDVQNWSDLLDPLQKWDGGQGPEVDTRAFGVVPVNVTGASTVRTDCHRAWELRLVVTTDGSATSQDIACGGTVPVPDGVDEAVLMGVRNGTKTGELKVLTS